MIHPVEALWCHDCGTLELEAILQSQLMELAGNLLPAVYSDLRQRGILPTFDGSILRFRRRDNNVTVRLYSRLLPLLCRLALASPRLSVESDWPARRC